MPVSLFNRVFQDIFLFFVFFRALHLQDSTCISTESATSVMLRVRSALVQRKRTAQAALNKGEND